MTIRITSYNVCYTKLLRKKAGATVVLIGRPTEEKGLTVDKAYEFLKKEFNIIENKLSHFPIFIDLSDKVVVVIGAGNIAARRIKSLLKFNSKITVIAPKVCDDINELNDKINIINDVYRTEYIKNAFMIIATTNSREINEKVFNDAKNLNILVNIADKKEESDFYFPAAAQNEVIRNNFV